jgi:alpha,alpha-trehalase
VILARANVDFLLDQVEAHGFAPNANRPWGMNRSQPPYLAMMARELWEAGGVADRAWLERAYRILQTEYRFWTTDEVERHTTPLPGLLRYSHRATRDEAAAFFDQVLVPRLGLTLDDGDRAVLAGPFLAEAESGMDFTPRFEDRCSGFVAVDLNVNLVLYEQTFAWMVDELGLDGEPAWGERARARWRRVEAVCWSEERGLFLDWDVVHRRHSRVASAMAFHPLWAGLASPEQAARVVASLPAFEHPGGIAVCEPLDSPSGRQWGEQAVWAPVQLLVITALDRYGYRADATRVAASFLDTVARNWVDPRPAEAAADGRMLRRMPGRLYEKYAADGRINDLEYPAHDGFGWTAGVFVCAYDRMNASAAATSE